MSCYVPHQSLGIGLRRLLILAVETCALCLVCEAAALPRRPSLRREVAGEVEQRRFTFRVGLESVQSRRGAAAHAIARWKPKRRKISAEGFPTCTDEELRRQIFNVSDLPWAPRVWSGFEDMLSGQLDRSDIGTPGATGAVFYPTHVTPALKSCVDNFESDLSALRGRRIMFFGNSVSRNMYFDIVSKLSGAAAALGNDRAAQKKAAKKALPGHLWGLKNDEFSHATEIPKLQLTLMFRWQEYTWGLHEFIDYFMQHDEVMGYEKPTDLVIMIGLSHILTQENWKEDARCLCVSKGKEPQLEDHQPGPPLLESLSNFVGSGGRIVWRTVTPIVPERFTDEQSTYWNCKHADNSFIQEWNRLSLQTISNYQPLANSFRKGDFMITDDFETVWASRRADGSLPYNDFVHPSSNLMWLLGKQSLCAI